MKEIPVNTSRELIERFGRSIAENYSRAIQHLERSLGNSDVPADKDLRALLAPLSNQARELKIAQEALETFIHDFMASLDESDVFKIVGTLRDGTLFDLRELCPEGLHGNQLDWLENFSDRKTVGSIIFAKDFLGKT